MIFKEIRIKNFRNLSELSTKFSPRINFFVGNNGQGKTNLLEALYLFSNGESFRYGENSVLIQDQQQESLVQVVAESKNLQYDLKLHLQKSKKTFTANDKKIPTAELRKRFTCVLFSPESLSSIKEAGDQRRDLVDELLVSLSSINADLLWEYKKALRSRNKLLKDASEGITLRNQTLALLESLEPSFLRLASQLTYARLQALKSLLPEFNAAMRDISQGPQKDSPVDISVEYSMSGQNALQKTLEEVHEMLHKRILELRDAELASGASLVGPQKHDIIFLYGQKDSRFYCSQGQQRAIILSFKMAQIVNHRRVHGFYPALMLDDVLSELDEGKRTALINFLHEINTQIFITTTDLTLPQSFALESFSVKEVKDGALDEAFTKTK